MRAKLSWVLLMIAVILGTVIGYFDSRPTWDDTGVTAGSVLLAAAILAALQPRFGWLFGLAVGTPVLAFNMIVHGRFGSALAIAVALFGAGVGYLAGKAIRSNEAKRPA